MDQDSDSRLLPPYLPYRTFQGFIESLGQGLPDRIDRSLLKAMSGSTQNQLLTALRYLKLTDQYGNPTEMFHQFVKAQPQERKHLLADLLHMAYPFLFTLTFNLATVTIGQLEEQFRERNASVDTARKNISFFLMAAKDAEITLSPYLLKAAQRSGISSTRATGKRAKSSGRSSRSPGQEKPGTPPPPAQVTQAAPASPVDLQSKLIDKYPGFDPTWPDEVKKMWFEGFGRLMQAIPNPAHTEAKTAATAESRGETRAEQPA